MNEFFWWIKKRIILMEIKAKKPVSASEKKRTSFLCKSFLLSFATFSKLLAIWLTFFGG